MLEVPRLLPPGGLEVHPAPEVITGLELGSGIRRCKHNATRLTQLAHALRTGATRVINYTGRQALALVPASSGYCNTVANLSAAERVDLERGWVTLAGLHRRRKTPTPPTLTDEQLDQLVASNPDRVLASLDCVTAPEGRQS
jgi:hypothetical protein